ncbi:hypothetical protein [Brevibacterium sediminis]|uniref:hypothetical protein n=1 Tax=Brevibacterium sediminis TaxID=1857024 RepID=UPI003B3AC27D
MNSIELIAKLRPTAELIEAASQVDVASPLPSGESLLLWSLANTDLESRYASTQWLLDQGCGLGAPDSEGSTELHILFGQVKHDVRADVSIAEQLIAIGADVNAFAARGGLVFCDVLWMTYTDDDLTPVYDLWFSQPGSLDFETESQEGRSPLAIARGLPYRATILERMERYVAEHS